MAQIIPVTNDARQIFSTVLDTQQVELRLYYLEDLIGLSRSGWFLDLLLFTDATEVIANGQRLQTFQEVSKGLVNAFVGAIYVIPITSNIQDLTNREPWGQTHDLVYFTVSDLVNGGVVNDSTIST